MAPIISVVIVTWNRRDDILIAVQSIFDQVYPHIEVIVVDNASSDGTVAALRHAYPTVTLVELPENRGVSGGRNAGISVAHGEIIFLLDSDASVGEHTLLHIVRKFEAQPTIGILACKILNAFTSVLCTSAWIYSEKSKAYQDTEFESYSFCECGCAIRKEVIERVGPFWTLLFFGREGDELSLRAWDAGYKILYFPQAVVYHRVSPHARTKGLERLRHDLQNSLYIYIVHYPWWMLLHLGLSKIGVTLFKATRHGGVGSILRTLLAVTHKLPLLLKCRRPIQRKTARLYMQLLRDHGPLSWTLQTWIRYKLLNEDQNRYYTESGVRKQ